jgi:luciferase family oxidoreductase group 1
MAYFRGDAPTGVRAVPGAGLSVPIWILGSSLFGAQLAAAMGLPFAFASHFAPEQLLEAVAIYRERFRPSELLERPYAMAGINVIAADDAAEARRLFTSLQQAFLRIRVGRPAPLPPPIDDLESRLTPMDRAALDHMLAASVVGDEATVRDGLSRFVAQTGVDELIVAAQAHDHAARLRSYEITARAASGPAAPA